MTRDFDRLGLLEALDAIGAAAIARGTRLDLAIYGGSALMLASNFKFATEDVDIAEIDARPAWLDAIVAEIATQKGWSADWLNEAVAFHLSPLAGTRPITWNTARSQEAARSAFRLWCRARSTCWL